MCSDHPVCFVISTVSTYHISSVGSRKGGGARKGVEGWGGHSGGTDGDMSVAQKSRLLSDAVVCKQPAQRGDVWLGGDKRRRIFLLFLSFFLI